ncbi:uncharacterized protein LOC109833394 isoform X2 [Asparagus officinalis]|uniref:uncharacterized protein LOC109833394 isoform X2 n=1 Tax=Asparagus officinalis TaxID=4686 RepID=UPI00098E22BD|nr:uncharacterized protein LOC109833394 isoform X2 [Asparagus officinalis]
MSSGEVRKVSRQDIQLVQNLIERCLQLYMNQKEVVDTLLYQAKIEPGFTELVWQKLEEENREFFKAYHVRLLLKNQILVFNKLLEKQVELMQKVCPPGVSSVPLSNGSSSSSLQQTPSCYLSDHASTSSRPDNMYCNGGGSSSAMTNGASSGHQNMQLGNNASILAQRMDISPSLLSTQNSHIGRTNGINGAAIKSEPSYSNNSEFTFCAENNFLETRPPLGVEPGASFSSSDLNGQQLSEALLDMDSSSFGFLSQIPRNFSFSDLTDDFTQSSDEERRLDTISEGISYDDFGSD